MINNSNQSVIDSFFKQTKQPKVKLPELSKEEIENVIAKFFDIAVLIEKQPTWEDTKRDQYRHITEYLVKSSAPHTRQTLSILLGNLCDLLVHHDIVSAAAGRTFSSTDTMVITKTVVDRLLHFDFCNIQPTRHPNTVVYTHTLGAYGGPQQDERPVSINSAAVVAEMESLVITNPIERPYYGDIDHMNYVTTVAHDLADALNRQLLNKLFSEAETTTVKVTDENMLGFMFDQVFSLYEHADYDATPFVVMSPHSFLKLEMNMHETFRGQYQIEEKQRFTMHPMGPQYMGRVHNLAIYIDDIPFKDDNEIYEFGIIGTRNNTRNVFWIPFQLILPEAGRPFYRDPVSSLAQSYESHLHFGSRTTLYVPDQTTLKTNFKIVRRTK